MPVNKRVLVVSNYPIRQPLHGGQKRVAAIVNEYRKAFTSVKFVAIFVREHYPVYGRDDLPLTGTWAAGAVHDHLTSDLRVADAMTHSTRLRKKIEKLLLSYRPDIIQFEQVFPFIGLQQILQDLNLNPKIVYSSQNIEAPMRKEIMELGKAKPSDIAKAIALIEEKENYLASHADLLTVVSKHDGDYYISKGAPRYLLATNGIYRSRPSQRAIAYWQKYFAKRRIKHAALFVGSGHLPNMAGLRKMIGFHVGFMPYDARIVIAGGAGPNIRNNFDYDNPSIAPYWRRVVNAGILSQKLLDGLIEQAEVILLPIVDGGGSNLKTAEAILSGKKVVATSFAFRGYEKYMKLPNIHIADSPKAFRELLVKAFEAPVDKRTKVQQQQASLLEWQYCLKDMVNEVSQL
jgi:hypothetical protein